MRKFAYAMATKKSSANFLQSNLRKLIAKYYGDNATEFARALRKAGLSVDEKRIADWRSGRTAPVSASRSLLAKIFNVTVYELCETELDVDNLRRPETEPSDRDAIALFSRLLQSNDEQIKKHLKNQVALIARLQTEKKSPFS